MNFDVGDMLSLLTLLIWTYMHVPKWINPIFHLIFTSQKVVFNLIKQLDIHVVAGLFEILQSTCPPSLAWLKALPAANFLAWGVYCLVLEKHGCIAKIYIGSGTAAKGGLKYRWNDYKAGRCLSEYVAIALREGYTITSMGCLLWCPIPSAANVPIFRVVIVALEACMTFLFWAIYSQTKDFGYGEVLPWSRQMVSWQGLCSHNPFSDGIFGDFNLSAEQLQAREDAVTKKNKEYQVEYGKAMRANADDEYRARQKAANAKRAPVQKAIDAETKASKKF